MLAVEDDDRFEDGGPVPFAVTVPDHVEFADAGDPAGDPRFLSQLPSCGLLDGFAGLNLPAGVAPAVLARVADEQDLARVVREPDASAAEGSRLEASTTRR